MIDEEKPVCMGSSSRIPNHDPVPNIHMTFGVTYKGLICDDILAAIKKKHQQIEDGFSDNSSDQQVVELTDNQSDDWEDGWTGPSSDQVVPVSPNKPVKRRKDGNDDIDDRIPIRWTRLFNECLIAGIKLLFQPLGCSRRKANRSYFDPNEKMIKWSIELVFTTEQIFHKHMINEIPETTTPNEILCFLFTSGFRLPPELNIFEGRDMNTVKVWFCAGDWNQGVIPANMSIREACRTHGKVFEYPTLVIAPVEQDAIKYEMDQDR